MAEEMWEDAERRFQAARARWDPQDPSRSIEGMREITHLYPLWGKGHGALWEVHKHLGHAEEALYHFVQLVVVQPSFGNLLELGALLGRAGRLEDACVVLDHLLGVIHDAPTPQLARSVFDALLVTLTRLQQGARMVEVADLAVVHCGQHLVFEYQAVLGYMLAKEPSKARTRLATMIGRVPADHPLAPKVEQMRHMLGM